MKLPKRRFQQELKQRFSKDEIRTMCFSLGIDHEELDEKTITTLTESLLFYVEKRGLIIDLVEILSSERPHVDWSALAFADVDCPYRGLLPFREEDAHLFFGRDAYIERLLEAVNKRPLIAVIGPSGSGKSSVVFAGLVPRLRPTDQQQTGQWHIIDLSPGKTPFETLSGELIPLLEPDLSESAQFVEANVLSENLLEGKILLQQIMARIVRRMDGGKRILLIVDQYEELYTQTKDATLQEDFTKALLGLHEVEAVTVLLTMRADFLDRALAYRPFADELQAAIQMIGPMGRDELIEVIERPLSGTFVTFEPGLTTQILDDVGKEPGNLPLLEFALESLWQEQMDGQMTFAVYEKIGKVEGALTKQADAAFTIYEEKSEDDLVRRLFVQLVQPVNTSVNTKRKAWRSELGDELWQLAAELADARLIVTNQDDKLGEDYIELAHEALITNWERFDGWIREDWEFRAWQERLRINLRQWESHEEDEGFLLFGAPLSVAEEWLQQRHLDLNKQEIEYINTSNKAQAQRLAEEAARQERELAQAQALAAEQQKRAEEQKQAANSLRKRLVYAIIAVVVAMIAVAAAVFLGLKSNQNAIQAELSADAAATAEVVAIDRADEAERALTLANARQLVSQGQAEFEEDPLVGLALVLEGLTLAEQEDRVSVLGDSQRRVFQWARTNSWPIGTVRDFLVSPDEAWLLVNKINSNAELRTASSGFVQTVALPGEIGVPNSTWRDVPVGTAVFSPNSEWLVLDYADSDTELRNATTGFNSSTNLEDLTLPFYIEKPFSPNSEWLLLGGIDNVKLVNVVSNTTFDFQKRTTQNVFFSPNGEWLWISFFENNKIYGELRSNSSNFLTPELRLENVDARKFSPDSEWLVLLTDENSNLISELRNIASGFSYSLPARALDVTFSPTSEWVSINYHDDIDNRPDELLELFSFATIEIDASFNSKFSPNGEWFLLKEGSYGFLRAADSHFASNITVLPRREINGEQFSPDSKWLILNYGGVNGELRSEESDFTTVTTLNGQLSGWEFSDDGKWLWVLYSDSSSEVIDLETGKSLTRLIIGVAEADFLISEQKMAVVYRDGQAHIIDLEWLTKMQDMDLLEAPIDEENISTLIDLACQFPLFNGEKLQEVEMQAALRPFLEQVSLSEPQACQ